MLKNFWKNAFKRSNTLSITPARFACGLNGFIGGMMEASSMPPPDKAAQSILLTCSYLFLLKRSFNRKAVNQSFTFSQTLVWLMQNRCMV